MKALIKELEDCMYVLEMLPYESGTCAGDVEEIRKRIKIVIKKLKEKVK